MATIRVFPFLSFALLIVFPVEGQLTTRYTVENLRFEGNETFSSRQLERYVKLKPPGFLRSTEFNRRSLKLDAITLKNFYASQGFLQAEVVESYAVMEGEEVAVVFRIREGPRSTLRSWTVEGNESLSEKLVARTLGLKVGKPFNVLGIRQAFSRLTEEYGRIGKLFVTFEQTYVPSEDIDYHLIINEGPTVRIDRILIEGLDGLDSSFVLREILLDTGSVYNGDRVKDSQRQIFETGLFSLVNLSPVKSSRGDAWVNILVELRRFSSTREIQLEPGIAPIRPSSGRGEPISGVEGTVQFVDRNLFGSGQRLGMKGSVQLPIEAMERAFGQLIFRTEASVSGLWTGKWRTPNALKLFGERVPEEREAQKDRFVTRYGWEWNGLHHFSDRANLRGGLEWTQILSSDPEDRQQEQERRIWVRYRYRDFDHPIKPSEGMSFSLESSMVGLILGGDRHYYSLEMDFRRFLSLGSSSVLAFRTKLGRMESLTSDTIPTYDRFYLGGSTSLRGWQSQAFPTYARGGTDGGLIKVLVNLEFRIPVWWVFGVDLFVDGGVLASRATDLEAAFPDWIKGEGWNYGAELTVSTPLGPVRLYYAVPLRAPSEGIPNLGVPYAF
ncbi:MAG: outer membrane protein assembly factor [Fidelibacterota bacterium]